MRVQLIVSSLLVTLAIPISGQASRICIAPTSVESAPGNSEAAASAVRESFASFLTGPTLNVSPLESRLLSQARLEAKSANCQYVLLTSVKHARKSGSSLFQRMAGSAAQQTAWSIGSSATSTTGRVVASAARGAVSAAASQYANSTKSHDELTLVTRLEAADGRVVFEQKEARKAKSDGEDLLTTIVQKQAESIAALVHPQ